MRLLLDTPALIWWLEGNKRLSRRAARAIEQQRSTVMVSAVSALEITTKVRLGRLTVPPRVASDLAGVIAEEGFVPLEITIAHAQLAGELPGAHADPFDRLLAAQARLEDLRLVSNDAALEALGAKPYW